MKPLTRFATGIAISCIFLTACKKDLRTSNDLRPETATLNATQQGLESAAISKEQFQELYARLRANGQVLGSNLSKETKANLEGNLSMLRRVAGVEPTLCDPHTALFNWLDQQRANWTPEILDFAFSLHLITIPADYAFFFENSSNNQSFGVNGEYTQKLTKTFKDLKRFWSIESSDMVMVPMHGSVLRDREKLIKIYMVYGVSAADAPFYADFVLTLMNFFPQYQNGNHPYFTFNAYANPATDQGPYGLIPAKIVMGDGNLQGFSAIGYDDVAPQAILAHEYGHQVQFQLGLFTNGTPESTRKMEMMADALSAYYLSHARGATMQWKRVQQFLQVFFDTGGCAFDSPAFHGTPTQRMAAALWGYNLANDAKKQGHILTPQAFVALFDAQFPALIAR